MSQTDRQKESGCCFHSSHIVSIGFHTWLMYIVMLTSQNSEANPYSTGELHQKVGRLGWLVYFDDWPRVQPSASYRMTTFLTAKWGCFASSVIIQNSNNLLFTVLVTWEIYTAYNFKHLWISAKMKLEKSEILAANQVVITPNFYGMYPRSVTSYEYRSIRFISINGPDEYICLVSLLFIYM